MSLTSPTKEEVAGWSFAALTGEPEVRALAIQNLLTALAQQTEAGRLLAAEVRRLRGEVACRLVPDSDGAA